MLKDPEAVASAAVVLWWCYQRCIDHRAPPPPGELKVGLVPGLLSRPYCRVAGGGWQAGGRAGRKAGRQAGSSCKHGQLVPDLSQLLGVAGGHAAHY